MDDSSKTWEYISKISAAGRKQHSDTLLDCMEFYGVNSTKELNLEQVLEYWKRLKNK